MVPVAQLDRAPDYESGGWEFESLRARQIPKTYGSFLPRKKRNRPFDGRLPRFSQFYDLYNYFSRYSGPLPLRKASG